MSETTPPTDTRARLLNFYEKYNPDKIDEVDDVLDRYVGHEEKLFAALVRKYGPEPGDEEIDSDSDSDDDLDPRTIDPLDYHARLTVFYQKYNPDKMNDVLTMLMKYQGHETKLFDALVKKYGPEPRDLLDEESSEEEQEEEENYTRQHVEYCPIDTLPAEYCEYGPCFDECKPWLAANCPDLLVQKYNRTIADLLDVEDQIAAGVEGISLELTSGSDPKKNKRKLGIKDKKVTQVNSNAKLYIERVSRSKRKCLTFIQGLDAVVENMKLKDAAKKLGKKFACSASVNKMDGGSGMNIQLQGDCSDVLPDVLVDMFGVELDRIYFVEKGTPRPAF